jgi:predicted glycogen debranching enzyme
MRIDNKLIQDPAPGTRIVKFRGDIITFTLELAQPLKGTAWVRTNIGHAKQIRREIINEVEHDQTRLGTDWFDISLNRLDDRRFSVTLPLVEAGHFEAKCFFLHEGENDPVWPEGPNTAVNVDSADSCCANIIYNAFVRQFGPNKSGQLQLTEWQKESILDLDQIDYTVIPPSGTFRDLISELDFIIGRLGCRMLLLLPIHPTPTTYGRMGRFGSPYAALSFTAVDPALAVFDPHATPLEQFIELVDAVHRRNGQLLIDIAINHTGWAARLHETHPNWLVRDPRGRIEVPGAWGVRWEDLTKLDYSQKGLWRFMADVFITWCHRGVDGFRCDAGYMIPQAAWKYIVAKVRTQYPDTLFLLEGLGGKVSVTRDLLNTANLNWAYSELFQNYDRQQIENYLPEALAICDSDGVIVHFAETHDNPRLADRSMIYARLRTALCALFSQNGAFGFANGVEWLATEKINVHDAASLNWNADTNQVDLIRRLNHLLKCHPAFHDDVEINMIQQNDGNYIVLLRHHLPSGKKLLVITNLDDENSTRASWNPNLAGIDDNVLIDLLTGDELTVSGSAELCTCQLGPGQVLCLSPDSSDVALFQNISDMSFDLPERVVVQRLQAKVLEVFTFYNGYRDISNFDCRAAVRKLTKDPATFCAAVNSASDEPGVILWHWPRDIRREVMLPPDQFLLVIAEFSFRARIMDDNRTLSTEVSLPSADGSNFALFSPLPTPKTRQSYVLKISVNASDGDLHEDGRILMLPRGDQVKIERVFGRQDLAKNNLLFLSTNQRGGMLRAAVSWGHLASRYDALLAANLSPDHPDQRWIMFTRCRAWLVYQGYSQELNTSCLESFGLNDKADGLWQYQIPTGQGEHVRITVKMRMIKGQNAAQIVFLRQPSSSAAGLLSESKSVRLILRPDIEHRNFHETTKAYMGPEYRWPGACRVAAGGFRFSPDEHHHLHMRVSQGAFVMEPEWQYMVTRPLDEERGMDPNSDLFSPGYFAVDLKGSQQAVLSADITTTSTGFESTTGADPHNWAQSSWKAEKQQDPPELLERSINDYVVKRADLKTVIAGYPWFLDWGRDALIFTRGLIAANCLQPAREVLTQFGQFEEQGTLPNMIAGRNAGNRDTSDAPLWLFTACADLLRAEGNDHFIDRKCNHRSFGEILVSIGQSIITGTPKGVHMDPDSALIFSPVHFTWMDTDHPAGTPREGYPIEIQALWAAALRLLSKIDEGKNRNRWTSLLDRVRSSIEQYFWQDDLGYLSDCLHASPGRAAGQATADDALRPNQLLAITLGAISDHHICREILNACQALLVPGAIRSLADKPVTHPIEIIHGGKRLNDPHHPYQGSYIGDEDTQRKPAYHNGTAWTWMFPSYCEAWAMVYPQTGRQTALAWLAGSVGLLEHGCMGHVPEILDGDIPHTPRGCDAQAWGASELLRVWKMLSP